MRNNVYLWQLPMFKPCLQDEKEVSETTVEQAISHSDCVSSGQIATVAFRFRRFDCMGVQDRRNDTD